MINFNLLTKTEILLIVISIIVLYKITEYLYYKNR